MKITGGSVIVEMEMVEARVLLKLLAGLSIDNCKVILNMTEDEIKISDDIYKSLDGHFEGVL